ncbi:efflux RND transporter permease subunit [Rheinheimera texasensis]|uniref:efflux RND transporter permease subunit n=1 Tax=Rheinheimera texasensis TaxID=306205 RepID=UPI0004E17ECC|nr:efflux RND transporter permease subunit [Rheinheimera texasensis]
MSFNLSVLAVRERAITLFFILLAFIGGTWAFLSLGRAEDPSFTIRALVVSAYWPGATAEEVQSQLADRLEKRIQEVRNIHKIDSQVRPGAVNLTIEFKDYTPSAMVPDLFYQIRKRMQEEAANMPAGAVGPLVNDNFSDVYFSLLSLTAPGLPFRDLSRQAEQLRDELSMVPGVLKAVIVADRPERVFIDFDQKKLAALGISLLDLQQQITAASRMLPAGQLETQGQALQFRLDARTDSFSELQQLPVRVNGKLIRLSEIATMQRGYEEPARLLARTGGDDAILVGVVMQQGENGLVLGKALQQKLGEIQAQLPLGMELHQLTNQAEAISKAVNLFEIKFLVAVLVVMAVSVLAIGLRAGLVVGIAIPLTLGITFLLMKMADINLDRITLGALIISLGLLVDDAIIAIEMMMVKMEQGVERVRAAGYAWSATAAPMLFGTLVTIAGFVPIGFAKSGVGEYTGNIFWVVGFALIVSWVVAVTFTPYLGVKLLPDVKAHAHDPYQTPFYSKLRALVLWCIGHKKTVISIVLLAFVLALLGMAKGVQKQFFPSSDRPEVLVSVYMPHGSAIANTDAVALKIEQLLKDNQDVRSLSSFVGAGAPRFFISANPEQPDPSFAKILIVAKDAEGRDRLIQLLNEHIAAGEFSAARVRVTRLLFGPPVPWPVSFRVMGKDPLELRRIAYLVRDKMVANPNTVGAHLEWEERMPVLALKLDTARLLAYGLTAADVAQQLQFQFSGASITQLREDIRTVDVTARLDRAQVLQPDAIELKTPGGKAVSIRQLGEIRVQYEEPLLKRYNRQTYLAVVADVQGAQPNDVSNRIWAELADIQAQLPPGYRIMQAGSVEESGKANASIQKLMPLMVALMLIFIMLQMRSFTGMWMVLATAPLGLIGATLALLVFRQPFGFVALLGLIGLAGILMRNTLILTQQVSDNLNDGWAARDAVVEATIHRARPVLLTALAAMLAFVPLTLDTFWGPMAFVLIGGVGVGTALTLLFVPALYMVFFRKRLAQVPVV